MVHHYQPRQRGKVLKDTPFYIRHFHRLRALAYIVPFILVFGPSTYQFLFPSQALRLRSLDPRQIENQKELRKKFTEREKALEKMKNISPENEEN